ncbi:peptidoglycan DD-metalloendopeptidase family protein [Streptomyces sp. NPDC013178]|uniref:peptidoglycan DD-metalloendopeptidase family protein n=1 Tax=Streptomyces sp. NPDC013178 TaxID=3155118 RepID=UPI0033C70AFB
MTGTTPLAVLLAVLLAVVLVALAPVPADAGSGARSGGVREEAARVVRAHEQAREEADRLREAGADDRTVEAAEQRRKAIRSQLWDMLWAVAQNTGDPAAVDPSGRDGQCFAPEGGRPPNPGKQQPNEDRKQRPEDRKQQPNEDRKQPSENRGDRPEDRRESSGARGYQPVHRGYQPVHHGDRPVHHGDRPEHHNEPPKDRTPAWTAPTRGYWLSAGYADSGPRWAHRHTGQDFAVPTGTPVYAVGPGTVRVTTCGDGFGHQVLIRHPYGYFTQYAHLSRIDVRKGERVTAGRRLGLSGATGNVTGPHLHFEVRITPYMGSAVPPLPWLRRKGVEVVPDTPVRPSPTRPDREMPREG